MSELKKIYCKSFDELPTFQTIKHELAHHDRIRIDYDIHATFKDSDEFEEFIDRIRKELNVEIQKGDFEELEFYNIYNLFSETDLKEIAAQLELAAKDYRLTSEKLIGEFETKYDHEFINREKLIRDIREKLELDENKLSKNWIYRFHGGDVCFSNSKTGQVVDINLKFDGYYGVLDLWFFQYFMETTANHKSLSLVFKKSTPKLIQSLNYLKSSGKIILIRSELFDAEKLIWNKQ